MGQIISFGKFSNISDNEISFTLAETNAQTLKGNIENVEENISFT